ncbi:peptidoglycan editing factor PgeF [Alteromonas gracilis]|uniref:peptidoglycan editing factor PgeF n=1 Tax=Alteromonas gracilis TaxID=1479524 RepID=UPI0030D5C6AD
MSESSLVITPQWNSPKHIVAYTSTRQGGVSTGDLDGLNVGAHVGDDLLLVKANRALLPYHEKLSWLEQVHSNKVVVLPSADTTADAAYSSSSACFCAVMTADCVPILLCDNEGKEVAAVHGGWKGLESGVIANTISQFNAAPSSIMAWIGPAICQRCYEVDQHLAEVFVAYPDALLKSSSTGKFLLDLPAIAKAQLVALGLTDVVSSNLCTYCEQEQFYSHRLATHRGKRATGRIVSVIGITER